MDVKVYQTADGPLIAIPVRDATISAQHSAVGRTVLSAPDDPGAAAASRAGRKGSLARRAKGLDPVTAPAG